MNIKTAALSQLDAIAQRTAPAAACGRLRSTGGADLGLAWALDYFGQDLQLAAANRDPRQWAEAMRQLRTLRERQ
jgi:hypothetical protein